LISFSVTSSLALLSSATLAQQQTPESIASPPPLPGPPRLGTDPPATEARSCSSHAAGLHRGIRAPPVPPPTPYPPGHCPPEDTGDRLERSCPRLALQRQLKRLPCSTADRENDGSTTCVGLPDSVRKSTRTQQAQQQIVNVMTSAQVGYRVQV